MKKYFFVLMVFSFVSYLWCEPIELTVDKAITLALENNPDFKIADISLKTAEREKKNTWSNFLPSISGTAGMDSNSTKTGTNNTREATANTGLSFSLSLNPGIKYAIEQTKLEYAANLIDLNTARQQLKASVVSGFFYLITLKNNITIEKNNLDIAESRHKQAKINYEHGLASELEVLETKVSAASIKPVYSSAISDYENELRSYLIILGLEVGTEVNLKGSLLTAKKDLDETEKIIAKYFQNSPDILSGKNTLENLRSQRKETKYGNNYPTLSFTAGYSGTVDDVTSSTSWDTENILKTGTLGITLSVPLDSWISGSQDSLKVRALDDQIKQQEISLKQTKDSVKTKIINYISEISTNWENIELGKLTMEMAEESYKLNEEGYARGTVERLDVEDAQQNLIEARQNYLTYQYNYLESLINLSLTLGLDSWGEI